MNVTTEPTAETHLEIKTAARELRARAAGLELLARSIAEGTRDPGDYEPLVRLCRESLARVEALAAHGSRL